MASHAGLHMADESACTQHQGVLILPRVHSCSEAVSILPQLHHAPLFVHMRALPTGRCHIVVIGMWIMMTIQPLPHTTTADDGVDGGDSGDRDGKGKGGDCYDLNGGHGNAHLPATPTLVTPAVLAFPSFRDLGADFWGLGQFGTCRTCRLPAMPVFMPVVPPFTAAVPIMGALAALEGPAALPICCLFSLMISSSVMSCEQMNATEMSRWQELGAPDAAISQYPPSSSPRAPLRFTCSVVARWPQVSGFED
ncbi:hypothetical protein HaLaN_05868, partial [Haematococcus lacustris]